MGRYTEIKNGIDGLLELAKTNVEKSLNSSELEYNDAYLSGIKTHHSQFEKSLEGDDKEKALDVFFLTNSTLVKKQKERAKLAVKSALTDNKVRADLNSAIDFFSTVENLMLKFSNPTGKDA